MSGLDCKHCRKPAGSSGSSGSIGPWGGVRSAALPGRRSHLPQVSPAAGLCPSSSTAAGLVSKPAGPLLSGAAVVAPFAPRLLGASPCQMFLGSPAAAA